MKKLVVLLAITLSACGDNADEGKELTARMGTIRQNNGQWYLLDDTNHTPVGIKAVRQDASTIEVEYEHCAEIVSSAITPDESLARLGMTLGASVGEDRMFISFEGDVDPVTLTKEASANVWIVVWCY